MQRTQAPQPLFVLPSQHPLLEPEWVGSPSSTGNRTHLWFKNSTLRDQKKKKKYLIKIKKNNNKGTCQTNLDKARPEGQAESCITLETVSPLSISPLGTALSHAHRAPLCNLPCAESSFTNSEPPSSWTRHFSHGDTWLCTSLKSSPTFKHCGWLSKC